MMALPAMALACYELEVGRYIENIVDTSPISTYRYRYYIGTLDIVFFRYIDIVSVTSEILVFFQYFIILFPTF